MRFRRVRLLVEVLVHDSLRVTKAGRFDEIERFHEIDEPVLTRETQHTKRAGYIDSVTACRLHPASIVHQEQVGAQF